MDEPVDWPVDEMDVTVDGPVDEFLGDTDDKGARVDGLDDE